MIYATVYACVAVLTFAFILAPTLAIARKDGLTTSAALMMASGVALTWPLFIFALLFGTRDE